jgi:hypothetical protein
MKKKNGRTLGDLLKDEVKKLSRKKIHRHGASVQRWPCRASGKVNIELDHFIIQFLTIAAGL